MGIVVHGCLYELHGLKKIVLSEGTTKKIYMFIRLPSLTMPLNKIFFVFVLFSQIKKVNHISAYLTWNLKVCGQTDRQTDRQQKQSKRGDVAQW